MISERVVVFFLKNSTAVLAKTPRRVFFDFTILVEIAGRIRWKTTRSEIPRIRVASQFPFSICCYLLPSYSNTFQQHMLLAPPAEISVEISASSEISELFQKSFRPKAVLMLKMLLIQQQKQHCCFLATLTPKQHQINFDHLGPS